MTDDLQASLQTSFERHAARVALAAPNGSITYAALAEAAARLAAGLPRGAVVAVALEQRSTLALVLLACLRAGSIFMPLDLSYPVRRLAAMLSVAPPAVVVVEARSLAPARALCGDEAAYVCVDEPGAASFGLKLLRAAVQAPLPPAAVAPDDPCYLYFTSGTSGTPKGILGRYASLGHFVAWESERFAVDTDSRVSQLTSPAFDPFLRDVLVPLCAGGTLCLPVDGPAALLGPQLAAWLNQAAVSHLHIVPTLFRALLRQPLSADDFPALRYVLLAGEMLYGADVAQWRAVFGDRVQLVNLYGPTETTMVKVFHSVQPEDAVRTGVPVGLPLPGAVVTVVDDAGQACAPGEIGEVHIATPHRTLGYYGQPALTAAAFSGADGAYRTGDLGRWLPTGSLEILGRCDDQVKVNGVRVELGEIENALRQHPGVAAVAVRAWQTESQATYLAAYVVEAAPVDDQALRAYLLMELPWSLVPGVCVRLPALPLLPNGKVDRRALPDPSGLRRQVVPYAPPANALELALVEIWQSVLSLPGAPGVNDDFLSLGGESLQAVQLMVRLNEAFNIELPLMALFAAPTIAGLAALAQEALDEAVQDPGAAAFSVTYEEGEI